MLKEYIEYETTCFIDKDWDLSGILEINENTYIDFNRRTIYVNSVDQKIPATKMALLEKLILESPNVVTYEILFHKNY